MQTSAHDPADDTEAPARTDDAAGPAQPVGTASTSSAASDRGASSDDEPDGAARERRRRIRTERAAAATPKTITLSVSRATAVLGALCAVLAIAAVVFAGLWLSERSDAHDATNRLAAIDATNAQNKHAEDVASTYAIGAATIDYQNLAAWEKTLVANTSPELSNTLQHAASQMEQIYSPVQWQSTATPIAAVATSNQNGVITVNVFVSVITKTTQTPSGMPSTATYAVTVDTKQNWLITDVRGIDSALPK